jgi:hypothetical protein
MSNDDDFRGNALQYNKLGELICNVEIYNTYNNYSYDDIYSVSGMMVKGPLKGITETIDKMIVDTTQWDTVTPSGVIEVPFKIIQFPNKTGGFSNKKMKYAWCVAEVTEHGFYEDKEQLEPKDLLGWAGVGTLRKSTGEFCYWIGNSSIHTGLQVWEGKVSMANDHRVHFYKTVIGYEDRSLQLHSSSGVSGGGVYCPVRFPQFRLFAKAIPYEHFAEFLRRLRVKDGWYE